MRYRHLPPTVAILAFVLLTCTFLFSGCGILDGYINEGEMTPSAGSLQNETDGVDMILDMRLPPRENRLEWNEREENGKRLIDGTYEKVPLSMLLDFLRSLDENRWYITENMAYRGNSSLQISYSTTTQKLELFFTQDTNKKEWPDVLTPYLAYASPVFSFGEFADSEQTEIENVASATRLFYTDVTKTDVTAYEKQLAEAGYELESEENGSRLFKKNILFVSLTPHLLAGKLELVIGEYKVYMVPLPPWPDPMSEEARRVLPAVSAVCSVQSTERGLIATAQELTLSELYLFFKAAAEHYGWTALSDAGGMENIEKSFHLTVVSYDTEGNTLIFNLFKDNPDTKQQGKN